MFLVSGNGTPCIKAFETETSNVDSEPIQFGRRLFLGRQFMRGSLDEVYIIQSALSGDQIRDLMQGVPLPETNQNIPMQEMPPLPGQTSLPAYGNGRLAMFNGNGTPTQIQSASSRRVFNGRLKYGRHGGPIPEYQQPQNIQAQPRYIQAQPLIMNSNQPAQNSIRGISFSNDASTSGTTVPDTAPVPAYRRWLKMPRLPLLRK